jgi:hypothetical protein
MTLIARNELYVTVTGKTRQGWYPVLTRAGYYVLVDDIGVRTGTLTPVQVPWYRWMFREATSGKRGVVAADLEIKGRDQQQLGQVRIRNRTEIYTTSGALVAGAGTRFFGGYFLYGPDESVIAKLNWGWGRDQVDVRAWTQVGKIISSTGQQVGDLSQPLPPMRLSSGRTSTLTPGTSMLRFEPETPPVLRLAALAGTLLHRHHK